MRTNLDWSGVSGHSCRISRSPTAKLPRGREVDCWALKDCVTRRFFIRISSTHISARAVRRISSPGRGRRIDRRTPRGFGKFCAGGGPTRQVVPHVLFGERAAGQVFPFTARLQFGGDHAHAKNGPFLNGAAQGVEQGQVRRHLEALGGSAGRDALKTEAPQVLQVPEADVAELGDLFVSIGTWRTCGASVLSASRPADPPSASRWRRTWPCSTPCASPFRKGQFFA